MLRLRLVSALLLVSVNLESLAATPTRGPSVENGRKLFATVGCRLCHGLQGQGGAIPGAPSSAAPKLAPEPLPLMALTQFIRSRAKTPNYAQMPAYSEKVLSDLDIADIYAYLKSIPPSPSVDQIPVLRDLKNKK